MEFNIVDCHRWDIPEYFRRFNVLSLCIFSTELPGVVLFNGEMRSLISEHWPRFLIPILNDEYFPI